MAVALCIVAIFFSLAASQDLISGIQGEDRSLPSLEPDAQRPDSYGGQQRARLRIFEIWKDAPVGSRLVVANSTSARRAMHDFVPERQLAGLSNPVASVLFTALLFDLCGDSV